MINFIRSKFAVTVFIIVSIIVIVTIIYIVSAESEKTVVQKMTPVIVFDEVVYNFGHTQQGTELQHNFKFTNKGNALLKIDSIHTRCGCTGATIGEKTEFKKDESGEIKITFNTQGRSGHQEKIIVVYTNDPASPRKDLKVICDIDIPDE